MIPAKSDSADDELMVLRVLSADMRCRSKRTIERRDNSRASGAFPISSSSPVDSWTGGAPANCDCRFSALFFGGINFDLSIGL